MRQKILLTCASILLLHTFAFSMFHPLEYTILGKRIEKVGIDAVWQEMQENEAEGLSLLVCSHSFTDEKFYSDVDQRFVDAAVAHYTHDPEQRGTPCKSGSLTPRIYYTLMPKGRLNHKYIFTVDFKKEDKVALEETLRNLKAKEKQDKA